MGFQIYLSGSPWDGMEGEGVGEGAGAGWGDGEVGARVEVGGSLAPQRRASRLDKAPVMAV